MTPLLRTTLPVALAAALALPLGGCSLGGLLGGGGKPPATLQTLTAQAPDPGPIARTAAAAKTVTIGVPVISKQLRTVRVPVQVSATDVQYVTDLQWVDTPDRLFQDLLMETVRRTTDRVVLDPNQAGLDPGLLVHGELQRFGYDAQSGQAVVVYNASLSTAGGSQVETRRFVASVPADGTGASVGPALNQAANQVALDVAKWIGG
jgi:cholesterol transport system auxiliary component